MGGEEEGQEQQANTEEGRSERVEKAAEIERRRRSSGFGPLSFALLAAEEPNARHCDTQPYLFQFSITAPLPVPSILSSHSRLMKPRGSRAGGCGRVRAACEVG